MTNEARIPRPFFCFGASAGGIEALIASLDRLPADLDATFAIVVHRSPTAVSGLAGIFSRHSAMPVLEPHDGEPVRRGTIYLAPQDRYLRIDDHRWQLDDGTPVHRWRPAVDPLFVSAAQQRGDGVVGILLSGGGAENPALMEQLAGVVPFKRFSLLQGLDVEIAAEHGVRA